MPYVVSKRGKKYVLKKPGKNGSVVGTHSSRKAAQKQRVAIFLNEHKRRKRFG